MAFLNEQNQFTVHAGLQGLHALSMKYEFELVQDRLPLNQIIKDSFSVLGPLVKNIISNNGKSDALYMLYLIFKIFYKSNQLSLCPFLMEANNSDPWISMIKSILDMPMPNDLTSYTEDMDEIARRNKSIFWKIKDIASRITYRMFLKYGNPSKVGN